MCTEKALCLDWWQNWNIESLASIHIPIQHLSPNSSDSGMYTESCVKSLFIILPAIPPLDHLNSPWISGTTTEIITKKLSLWQWDLTMFLTVLGRHNCNCEVKAGSFFWSLGHEKLSGFESQQIWVQYKLYHITYIS